MAGRALTSIRHSRIAIFGLAIVLVVLVLAVLGPIIWGTRAGVIHPATAGGTASAEHPFGTDELGRDIFLRVLVATRTSVELALAATGIASVVGAALGSVTAVAPKPIRVCVRWLIDALLAFPAILVAIFIGAILGPGAVDAAVSVGVAASFNIARVVSSSSLSIAGQEYVQAARVVGVTRWRLLSRYMLPNIGETLILLAFVNIGSSIVNISSLSFLGLGVQAPNYDWGKLLVDGVSAIYADPMSAVGPALAISLTALGFGLAGEALAKAVNPILSSGRGIVGGTVRRRWMPVTPRRSPAQVTPPAYVGSNTGDGEEGTLAVEHVTVELQGDRKVSSVELISDVSFSVADAERVGIVGESGSGKTITALAITGLVPYPAVVRGSVKLDGEEILNLRKRDLNRVIRNRVAMVFQDPMTSLNPALRIGTQMTEGVRFHVGMSRADAEDLAVTTLRDMSVHAPDVQIRRRPHHLSGGMRQRVSVAIGAMARPSVLIADEPTTAVDVTVQAQVMDLLDRYADERAAAIVLISHNLALVSQRCDRIIVMYGGRVVEELTKEQLLTSPRHPYTRALLEVVPDMTRRRDVPLRSLPGQVPDPAEQMPGCRYCPRCPLAEERCRRERPPLTRRPDGQRVACWVANQDLS